MLPRARIAAAAVACLAGLAAGMVGPPRFPAAAVGGPSAPPALSAVEPASVDPAADPSSAEPTAEPASADPAADPAVAETWPGAPVLPPDAPSFGEARRARLARTAVYFLGGDDGYLDGGVFVLPVPLPWPPGDDSLRSWDLDVPGSTPVFLLAAVTPAKYGFVPDTVFVTVDGVPVPSPESFVAKGPQLPEADGPQDYVTMALVLSGLEPGPHAVTVACNGCTPAAPNPWLSTIDAGPRTYLLHVQPPAPGAISTTGNGATGAPPALWRTSSSVVDSASGPAGAGAVAGWQAAPGAAQPRAGLVADRVFYSAALDREMPYRVYLPPGYGDPGPDGQPPTRRYPVLYLLHGLDAGRRQWTSLGLIDELDRLAAGGENVPFIVVMPSGRTGYWVNHADGGPRWGDYVAKDLVGHVDATYRTVAQREARAIGGISMGGHGALQLALNNPDVFGTAGAHSPSLRLRPQAPPFLGGFFMNAAGGPGQAAYEARDPVSLVRHSTLATPPALWIDIGDQDSWAPRARELHTALLERGWAHQWQPATGNHDDAYWRGRMAAYVRFYRQALLPFSS